MWSLVLAVLFVVWLQFWSPWHDDIGRRLDETRHGRVHLLALRSVRV